MKDCHENFVTPDSGGKGRWVEGPQSWHGDVMPNRIKGLGLDDKWVVKFAGAADALWAELKAAEKEGRGTIIFNWTPNFTDAFGFTFIEFPPYFTGCRITDGGDLSTTGCGSPKGWLKKGVNYRFPRSHPRAYTAFTKLSFTTPQIGSMAALVDVDGMTHQDAAVKWLADNEDVWKPWTKSVLGDTNCYGIFIVIVAIICIKKVDSPLQRGDSICRLEQSRETVYEQSILKISQ